MSHSLNNHDFAKGVLRQPPKGIFAAIMEDQVDRFYQAGTRLVPGVPLAIRARNLWAVSDEPVPITLENRREFIAHNWVSSTNGGGGPGLSRRAPIGNWRRKVIRRIFFCGETFAWMRLIRVVVLTGQRRVNGQRRVALLRIKEFHLGLVLRGVTGCQHPGIVLAPKVRVQERQACTWSRSGAWRDHSRGRK